jgi:beta-glucosidase
MAMEPNNWRAFYTNTLREVEKGSIPMRRLDHAVARILAVKLRMGLFAQGLPSQQPLGGKFDLIGSAAHRELARQAVRESLVLLKNEHHLLPLKPGQRVLVAGTGADSLPMQNGGWTLTWQGTGTRNADFPGATSIWAGIRQAVAAAGGTAELSVDGRYTRKPDVAIVVFGEKPYAEYLGDRPNLEFEPRDGATLRLLRRLREAGIPVVSVFLTGRPLWVNREINASDAFVVAWLPGSEGEGVADVLFRKPDGGIAFDFRGKLPAAWPINAVDQPGLDGPHALFPYGYGLNDADNGDLRTLPTASGIEPGAIAVAGR